LSFVAMPKLISLPDATAARSSGTGEGNASLLKAVGVGGAAVGAVGAGYTLGEMLSATLAWLLAF